MYSLNKNKQYVIMCILYIGSFLMVLSIFYLCDVDHSYNVGLNKFINECLCLSDTKISKLLTSLRGEEYYLTRDKYKDNKHCLVSIWAFTHVVLYAMIGFFCPDLFYPSLIIGILFELGERIFNCHDILDVIFNTIGFGIGYQVNNLFLNKKSFKASIFYAGLIICVILTGMCIKIVNHN